MMFFVSLAEVLIWACTYLALSAIEGLEQALYFSMVTFTTLDTATFFSMNAGVFWPLSKRPTELSCSAGQPPSS